MVVVRGDTEKPLAASEHLVIGLGMIAIQTIHLTAMVVNFHAPHSLQLHVLIAGLQRPVRMIIAADKAELHHFFHICVDRVNILIGNLRSGQSFLDLLMLIRAGIVPVHVPGAAIIPDHVSRLVHIRLQRRNRNKIRITKRSVIAVVIVIRDGEHLIALLLIVLLHLLRRHLSIGKYGMAVKIRLVVCYIFRQQFSRFHFVLPVF